MLTKRISEQVAAIEELRRLRVIANEADGYKTRLDRLVAALTKLQQSHQICSLLLSKGAIVEVEKSQISALKSRLQEMISDFQKDPAAIVKANQDLNYAFWTPLRQLPEKIETVLLGAWQAFIREKQPNVSNDILNVLAIVTPFKEQVRTIRYLISQLETLATNLPDSEETFTKVDQFSSTLRNTWNNLRGDGIPADVLSFIKKAASNEGASYSEFSASVSEWLQSRDLLKSLRMVLR